MKGSALLFMLISWNIVISLCTFCFTRIFMVSDSDKKGTRKRK